MWGWQCVPLETHTSQTPLQLRVVMGHYSGRWGVSGMLLRGFWKSIHFLDAMLPLSVSFFSSCLECICDDLRCSSYFGATWQQAWERRPKTQDLWDRKKRRTWNPDASVEFRHYCETADPQIASCIRPINPYLFKVVPGSQGFFYLHLHIFLTDTNSFRNNGLADSNKFPRLEIGTRFYVKTEGIWADNENSIQSSSL